MIRFRFTPWLLCFSLNSFLLPPAPFRLLLLALYSMMYADGDKIWLTLREGIRLFLHACASLGKVQGGGYAGFALVAQLLLEAAESRTPDVQCAAVSICRQGEQTARLVSPFLQLNCVVVPPSAVPEDGRGRRRGDCGSDSFYHGYDSCVRTGDSTVSHNWSTYPDVRQRRIR